MTHPVRAFHEHLRSHLDDAVANVGDHEANGMPEMYFAAAILAADPELNHTTAIVTDGRYSGAMKGPCNLDLTGRFNHPSDPDAARSPGLFVRRARRLPI